MKVLSRLLNLPVEYYLVIFLLLVVILMANSTAGDPAPFQMATSLVQSPFEGFQTDFPERVHNAANVSGQEVGALSGNKGVLGIFEAEGLQAAAIDAPSLYDPVSKLTSSPECVGKNSYSRSTGGVCLDDEVIQAFRSRGGNCKD